MFREEGYKLIGAAFEVYNQLGYGMAEEVYQQSMEVELTLRNIPFRTKPELTLRYKDHVLLTKYKPDLIVFDSVIAELISDHEAQLFNYMRLARQPVGYLINFGFRNELQWKRYILSDLHNPIREDLLEH